MVFCYGLVIGGTSRPRSYCQWLLGAGEGGGGAGAGAGGDAGVDGGIEGPFFNGEGEFFASLGVGEGDFLPDLELVDVGPAFGGEFFMIELDDGHEVVGPLVAVIDEADAGAGGEAGAGFFDHIEAGGNGDIGDGGADGGDEGFGGFAGSAAGEGDGKDCRGNQRNSE